MTPRKPGRARGPVVALALAAALGAGAGCGSSVTQTRDDPDPPEAPAAPVFHDPDELVVGVDLSYVNQVLDHGGTYRDSAGVRSPYAILADHGANAVRLRLWHDPSWVRTDVYGDSAVPLYSGLADVTRAIGEARRQELQVLLDFHYSDTWADPDHQEVPAAWRHITDLSVLQDSVYAYTRAALDHLRERDLLPDMVQVGNEINCGVMSTATPDSFPSLSVCDGHWAAQGAVLNAGIRAVRDAAPDARVILHIAQPENVRWWFDGIRGAGGVSDFDIIGFSYYAQWSDQPLTGIDGHVSAWRERYGRAVMMVETAYPWTLENNDGYGNILGASSLVTGYPATPAGQRRWMTDLVQEVIDGGGTGVFYWEPAWITSGMKDLWGTGSSWENNAFFDFQGRLHEGARYMTHPYDFDS